MEITLYTIHDNKSKLIGKKLKELQLSYLIVDDSKIINRVAKKYKLDLPILQIDNLFFDYQQAEEYYQEQQKLINKKGDEQ